MSFKYEVKSGVTVVEIAGPGGQVIVIKDGAPYESETRLVEFPADKVKETETKTAAKETKAADAEGGGS